MEHTCTEEVTGVDLVQAQIRIAGGASLADLGLAKQVSKSPKDCTSTSRCSMQLGHGRTGRLICSVARISFQCERRRGLSACCNHQDIMRRYRVTFQVDGQPSACTMSVIPHEQRSSERRRTSSSPWATPSSAGSPARTQSSTSSQTLGAYKPTGRPRPAQCLSTTACTHM